MNTQSWFKPRFETINAILIAVVSLTTAFAVWRTSVVGSHATDASRQGLIDALKKQSFESEYYRKAYEEAGFAYQFAVKQAEVDALEASDDPAAQMRARNIRQYLLPNLQLLGQPLATDEKYQKSNGTYDLQQRIIDMPTDEEKELEPTASFTRADSLFSEQRWLVIGSVLFALSLFWLALAEVSGERLRILEFVIGVGAYLLGIVWFMGVEIVFYIQRGGL